jgi:hypothetical protein
MEGEPENQTRMGRKRNKWRGSYRERDSETAEIYPKLGPKHGRDLLNTKHHKWQAFLQLLELHWRCTKRNRW